MTVERPGWLLQLAAGRYRSVDGRYVIERDDAFARVCAAPHTVALSRDDWRYDPDTGDWARGYVCPGGIAHRHTRWQVLDTEAGDYLAGTGPGTFTTLSAATAALGYTGPLHQFIWRRTSQGSRHG